MSSLNVLNIADCQNAESKNRLHRWRMLLQLQFHLQMDAGEKNLTKDGNALPNLINRWLIFCAVFAPRDPPVAMVTSPVESCRRWCQSEWPLWWQRGALWRRWAVQRVSCNSTGGGDVDAVDMAICAAVRKMQALPAHYQTSYANTQCDCWDG